MYYRSLSTRWRWLPSPDRGLMVGKRTGWRGHSLSNRRNSASLLRVLSSRFPEGDVAESGNSEHARQLSGVSQSTVLSPGISCAQVPMAVAWR